MHKDIPLSANIGLFIDERLWYPGDAFTNPERKVDILALPVSGPWMKIGEAIDYAIEIKPKLCFPVHDGILKKIGTTNTIPPKILEPLGIKFQILEEGKETEI